MKNIKHYFALLLTAALLPLTAAAQLTGEPINPPLLEEDRDMRERARQAMPCFLCPVTKDQNAAQLRRFLESANTPNQDVFSVNGRDQRGRTVLFFAALKDGRKESALF